MPESDADQTCGTFRQGHFGSPESELVTQMHCDSLEDVKNHVCWCSCVQEETCSVKITALLKEERRFSCFFVFFFFFIQNPVVAKPSFYVSTTILINIQCAHRTKDTTADIVLQVSMTVHLPCPGWHSHRLADFLFTHASCVCGHKFG